MDLERRVVGENERNGQKGGFSQVIPYEKRVLKTAGVSRNNVAFLL